LIVLLRLLLFIGRVSPFTRRLLWRRWYNRLASRYGVQSWTFMNYGYAPADETDPLVLGPADEPDRFCIQLYHYTISAAELAGKRVLEVGAGRGGGASFLARHHQPESMIAVDFSPKAVALCQKRHAVPNLEFKVGDAEQLPFEDSTFDAVVNVESSHCYGHIDRFFSEATRVLEPGGWFLYTDFRETEEWPEVENQLTATAGLTLIESEDITDRVLAALAADDDRKRAMIAEVIPENARPLFEEFAGVATGRIFEQFTERTMIYKRFALQRTA
jgi:ubiquinone/menaquinone biosynthesis C-methylase UbiE